MTTLAKPARATDRGYPQTQNIQQIVKLSMTVVVF